MVCGACCTDLRCISSGIGNCNPDRGFLGYLQNPSISEAASMFVIGFVLVIDFIYFIFWYATFGAFPFKSDEWGLLLEGHKKKDPQ
jgi:hypothetical protein